MIFSWLGILKAVLQLANGIAGIVKDKQLMDAGEAKAMARNLSELASRLDVGADVMAGIEAMRDGEIDDALRGEQ
jgi:cytochrome c556